MPGKARKDQMNPEEIETHHVWSRCVGRAYLFGIDPLTGFDYSHRLQWLESAVEWFASVFAVDLGTYHWMSNHVHDIVRNRPDIAQTWSDEEAVWRWKLAWPKFEDGGWSCSPTDEEIEALLQRGREQEDYLPQLRRNLANISWYQARLKQSIALLANRETNKRGHHWEQRFGNRKLEDESEVVAGFLYNDMQQVRAGIEDAVEASDHSAIQRQIHAHARRAFTDFFGRQPQDGRDEDSEQVEQLEAMFANCFLSPIESGGPLLTVPEQQVPPTELVVPQGYLFEQRDPAPQTDAEQSENRDEIAENEPDRDESSRTCQAEPERRGRGRPRRRRPRTIHQRLRRRQRRRASRCSILGIPWSQYYDLVKRLEQLLVAERQPGAAVPAASPPGAVPDSCSPTSWWQSVHQFAAWLQSAAADLPASLADHLMPRPRGDPPAA